MAGSNHDRRELAYYYSLAQVGIEMVVPIGIGVWLDTKYSWLPWGTVAGAVLGLTTGLYHLVVLSGRSERGKKP